MRSVEWRVNVVPFIPGRQCVACGGVETCFLVPSEGNEFGEMAWIRGSLYPLRAMRSVVWRGNVFPLLRGGQYDRLNGMESWFLFYAVGNALGGWCGNVIPSIRGGQFARWSGVETCFLVTAKGNAHSGVEWKRVSLYPRRAMRSVEWRGNVLPCIRGGHCARWSGVETWFSVTAEGNAQGGVAWKLGSFIRGGQCSRWRDVENCFLLSTEGNAFGGVAWKRGYFYSRRAMRSVNWRGNVFLCILGGQCDRWSGMETWSLVSA